MATTLQRIMAGGFHAVIRIALLLASCVTGTSLAIANDGDEGRKPSRLESMTLNSELVPGPVEVAVLLPPGFSQQDKPHRLLLWLHGGGGDDSSYLNRELRPIIEAAWKQGHLPPLVVAVPSARRSFYMDYQDGSEKWESLILNTLLPTLQKKYGLSKGQEGTLIGGYSMGGMGSLRIAFKHPKRFAAVAAIAPAIEPTYQFSDIAPRDREHRNNGIYEEIFGDPVDQTYWQANHPPTLARDRARSLIDSNLKIYFEVGDADELGLFRGGEFLHRILLQKNAKHEYRLVHGAGHEDGTLPDRLADAVRFLGRMLAGNDSQAIRELKAHMDRYVELFNHEQAAAIGKEIYSAPVLLPQLGSEQHSVVRTTADVQKHWADTFTKIKVRGWSRSVVHDMHFRMAGPDMAFAGMTFSRLRANGEAIPPKRRTADYVLLKGASGWRLLSVSSQAEPAEPASPQAVKGVETHMKRYVALCNEEGFEDVAREIFHAPVLWRVDRQVQVDMTGEAIRERFVSAWKIVKKNGWRRSVVHDMGIRVPASDLAFVDVTFTRLKADGTAMPPGRRTWSHVLIKRDSGWRIVSALEHSASE